MKAGVPSDPGRSPGGSRCNPSTAHPMSRRARRRAGSRPRDDPATGPRRRRRCRFRLVNQLSGRVPRVVPEPSHQRVEHRRVAADAAHAAATARPGTAGRRSRYRARPAAGYRRHRPRERVRVDRPDGPAQSRCTHRASTTALCSTCRTPAATGAHPPRRTEPSRPHGIAFHTALTH
jgi:hypothetical protein